MDADEEVGAFGAREFDAFVEAEGPVVGVREDGVEAGGFKVAFDTAGGVECHGFFERVAPARAGIAAAVAGVEDDGADD